MLELAVVVAGIGCWALLETWSRVAAFVFLFAWIGGWAVYRRRRAR